MKQLMTVFCVALFSLALLTACGEDKPAPKAEAAKPSAQTMPANQIPGSTPASESFSGSSGKVIETMDAGGYTYVQVDTGTEKIWAAAPQFAVKVGDDVVVPEGMPMANFASKTLNRTFEVVYFVPSVLVGGGESLPGGLPQGHPPMEGNSKVVVDSTKVDFSGITVAAGGQSVADIYAKKAELAGKPVKVRGKVIKFNSGIMGKNWIHVQDGTGTTGSNDLTVTTTATVQMGDTVVVSGVLIIDKDFGSGYAYDVIVEDAAVTVE